MDVGSPILAEDLVAARLASNFALATSSTTLQNVTGLSVPVKANAVYVVEAALHHAGAGGGTTEDIKYSFTFPTGASFRCGNHTGTAGGVSGVSSTDMDLGSANFTSGSSTVIAGASSSGTMALIKGTLAVGANAGTFQVQAAQNTSGTTVLSVVFGSHILLTRIA